MVRYKEIKNKDRRAQLREAQLAISDLLASDLWKEYESFVYKEEKELDKLKTSDKIEDKDKTRMVSYNIRKNFIAQLKTFADNRRSLEMCLNSVDDAYSLMKSIEKSNLTELRLENTLKKMIVSALHKYIGIIHLIESEY